jgi:mgtE-like transporter
MKESVPLLTICIAIEIVGGQILNHNEEQLIKLPILLVMIPVINGLGGNIGSILGARLSSALHLGTIQPKGYGKNLQKNVLSAALLGIISYIIVTIFILVISPWFGVGVEQDFLLKAGYIMIGSGLMLTAIVIVISVFVARFSFENGFDPDNTVIPIVTTVCDVLGIVCLILMIGAVGV